MRRLIAPLTLASLALALALAAGCAEPGADRMKAGSARQPATPERGDGPVSDRKADKAEPPRKIVYTGNVSLVVEDFDRAEALMMACVKDHGGYVARSEVIGEPGEPRHGSWTIRVPVLRSEEFRKEVVKLGELRRNALDSRDVTDEYYDTQALLKNLEAREAALREMYKQKAASSRLSDLLEVDRELTRVRGEIDVRKGQIQRWDKEVEFTTYSLTMYDRRGYVPPESPEFRTRIGRTWHASLDALESFGKTVVLIAVALAPWTPVIVALVLPAWLLVRLARRRSPPPAHFVEERRTPRRPPAAPVLEAAEVVDELPGQNRPEGPEGD